MAAPERYSLYFFPHFHFTPTLQPKATLSSRSHLSLVALFLLAVPAYPCKEFSSDRWSVEAEEKSISLMVSLQMEVRGGKSYECKFCGMAFSDGRVLGGHVRGHIAAAGLAGRSKKLLILGESSEGDGGVSRRERGGYGLRENRKKSWKFSGMKEERRKCSPRGKIQCGVCERVFRTSRALFGHMRLHPKKERRIGGTNCSVPCFSETEASLEEILSDYERILPMKRKKRSVRTRSDENLPGKDDMFLSAFLAGGIHRDEVEAAICLLMISRGVRHLELSGAVNKIWENMSPLVNSEDESDDSDGSELGVSNKRRVGDNDNASVDLQEVSGSMGSFSTCSNVEVKLMEWEISHMVSQGFEVQSRRRGYVVEEVKHLVGESGEVVKVSEQTAHDELGGECEKKLPPDFGTRKHPVPPKKEGYKCKKCGKIFPIHQALGGHCAKFRNGNCQTVEKSENNAMDGKDPSLPSPYADEVAQMVSVTEAALTEPDHKCPTCGKVFSSGQALGGHKRRHYNKGNSAIVSKRSAHVSSMKDVRSPLEVFEGENKLMSSEHFA